jgi:formylglycine-generating enzyme required for sulfatase activity
VAPVWEAVKNTANIAALDDFIRQFGGVPVYGPLARARREELAKQQHTAVVAPPVKPAVVDPCEGPVTPAFPSRCAAPLTAQQERGLHSKDAFRECGNCPEMVVVPAGSFTMGSPENEESRLSNEGPQHVVTIGKPFAVGKMHVTVDQFDEFVRETRYEASRPGCWTYEGGKGERRADRSWRNPGYAQERTHPVVCVAPSDAMAYVDWLAKKTGKSYRLLSEAEWEYAARGRTSPGAYPRFWFGNDEKELCQNGNGPDQRARDILEKSLRIVPCSDGYAYTSPAGHYTPNAFGLYDMAGNAWQWTADCLHGGYNGAPADGSAWTTGNCSSRMARGGSWFDDARYLRAATRILHAWVNFNVGFRLARELTR